MSEEVKEYKLTKKEQKRIRKMCTEVTAIHKFIDDEKIGEVFKDNAERFIGITAFHTKNLISHSVTLTNLTWALIGLTLIHIFLILNMLYKWSFFAFYFHA